MNASWMQWIRGFVTIRVKGESAERLVNRALASGLQLWSIRRTSGGELMCEVTVGDFFRLRPLLKETSCRNAWHFAQRAALLARSAGETIIFWAGLILFFVGMYLLSSLIWTIDVKGMTVYRKSKFYRWPSRKGYIPFSGHSGLRIRMCFLKRLAQKLPGAAWVGVDKRGTKITIQVVETTIPEVRPLLNPRHLVASTDAVVTQIMADAGRPVVSRNMRVKKGDILISGILGDEGHTRNVVAKGSVKGIVWHEYNIPPPFSVK